MPWGVVTSLEAHWLLSRCDHREAHARRPPDDELRLRSRQDAIKRVLAIVRKYIPDANRSLADELIAERREEAAREERE